MSKDTYANWEKDQTRPIEAKFRPVVTFLGFDPSPPPPKTLKDRLEAKQRASGATLDEIARYLGWDSGTLARYLKNVWPIPPVRAAALEAFLDAPVSDLSSIYQLPRRARSGGG